MKMRHYFLLCTLLPFSLLAQTFGGYMRLTGNLPSGKEIILHLHRDTLGQEENQTLVPGTLISGIIDYGTAQNSLSGYFHEGRMKLQENDMNFGFGLIWTFTSGTDSSFLATRKTQTGDQEISLVLKESYPEGSTPLRYLCWHKTIPHPSISEGTLKNRPEARLTVILPVFPETTSHIYARMAYDEMLNTIYKSTEINIRNANLESSIPEYVKLTETEWVKNTQADIESILTTEPENPALWGFSLEQHELADIMYNQNGLIILNYHTYFYSGGAHGMQNLSSYILDTQNGNLIQSQDIIYTSNWAKIKPLAEKYLRVKLNIPEDQALEAEGLLVQELPMPENISASPRGLICIYQPYEITSYALGIMEIEIPWKEAESILPKNFPLKRIIAN